MKIELEAKEGYEWVEVDAVEYVKARTEYCCQVILAGKSVCYLLKPIKPKYDYSDFTAEDLLEEFLIQDYAAEHACRMELSEEAKEKYDCAKVEILRRMNRED